jgi:hypothetical protein
MQSIVNWIRSLLILYFLMMILLYFTAGTSCRKLIRFFMGIVLLLTAAAPLFGLLGGKENLLDQISYESFRQYTQELSAESLDMEKDGESYSRTYCERLLARQFLEDAKKEQLGIRAVEVSLNDAYEPRQVRILEENAGDGVRFRSYLMDVYQLEEGQVLVE